MQYCLLLFWILMRDIPTCERTFMEHYIIQMMSSRRITLLLSYKREFAANVFCLFQDNLTHCIYFQTFMFEIAR